MCRARAWRGSGGGWTRAALWRRPSSSTCTAVLQPPRRDTRGAAPPRGTRWARGADAPWGSGWHQLLWLPPRWQPLVTLLLTSEALSFMHDSHTRLHSPCRGKGRRGAHCPLCFPVRGPRSSGSWSPSTKAAPVPFVVAGRGATAALGVPPVPWGP